MSRHCVCLNLTGIFLKDQEILRRNVRKDFPQGHWHFSAPFRRLPIRPNHVKRNHVSPDYVLVIPLVHISLSIAQWCSQAKFSPLTQKCSGAPSCINMNCSPSSCIQKLQAERSPITFPNIVPNYIVTEKSPMSHHTRQLLFPCSVSLTDFFGSLSDK